MPADARRFESDAATCRRRHQGQRHSLFLGRAGDPGGEGRRSFISPFLGRLDDIGENGLVLLQDIIEIYRNYDWKTEVLAASMRHPIHVIEAARMGADIATMPFKVIDQMFNHPLTDKGQAQFLADWRKSGRK